MTNTVIMTEGLQITAHDLELSSPFARYEGLNLREAREALEKDFIERSLRRNKGNMTRVAEELGISRPTLYELVDKLKLEKT